MKTARFTPYLLATSIAIATGAQAAEVRINGFASVVGGKTFNQGAARDHLAIRPSGGTESKATFVADSVTEGIYDDEVSFKPDSNFGVQVSADLGQGLSVTGQITGNGGENFDANISWAYITYEFNENWSLMAGRQRLPFFFYSDFIDVGYAYHWIRPPQDLAASTLDTFEGVKLNWATSTDSWDWTLDAYYGAGDEEIQGFGGLTGQNIHGIVAKTSNDWLQLRATYSHLEIYFEDSPFYSSGVQQATSDEPVDYSFYGVAAHMTFDNIFVVSEYTYADADDGAVGPDFGISGSTDDTGWYVSSGMRLGDFTPHITYGERTRGWEETGHPDEFEYIAKYWTLGARWDFHPSAAAKIEYTTRADESDDYYQNSVGGFGYGETLEVDVFAMGIDVIF